MPNQSSSAISIDLTLYTETCGGCGVTFAVPRHLHRSLHEEGGSIRCPTVDCGWPSYTWTNTENAKLQMRLDFETRMRRSAEQSAESERRRHSATKGKLTKTCNRIANGVCPCCNRIFVRLGQHMKSKHPEYGSRKAVA